MMEIQNCSKADISRYLTLIRLNFENAYPTRNDDEVTLLIESWYAILKPYPRDVCNEAVMQTLKRARFAPRVGDIVETIEKMQNVFQKSDNELWVELIKVLPKARSLVYAFQFTAVEDNGRTQGDNARIELSAVFEGLPKELKAYLHSESGLRQLSDYDDEQLSYERGRFMRIMPQVKEREKTRKELPANVAALVKGVEENLLGEKKLLNRPEGEVEENT